MIQNIILYSTCLCVQSNFKYKRKTLQRLIFFFSFKINVPVKKKKKNFQGLKKKTSLVLTQPVLFYYLKTKTKMFFLLKEETFFFNLCHFLFHHNLLYAKQQMFKSVFHKFHATPKVHSNDVQTDGPLLPVGSFRAEG